MLFTVPSVSVKTTLMNTTKMAAPSPIPKAKMANGIQATEAMGASKVTVGSVSLPKILT